MTVLKAIDRFGDSIEIGENAAKGFVLPMHPKDGDIHRQPYSIGVENGERYLLISCAAVNEGDTVLHGADCFEVCRSTAVYFADAISHYEAVLRPKGRSGNV